MICQVCGKSEIYKANRCCGCWFFRYRRRRDKYPSEAKLTENQLSQRYEKLLADTR